MVERTPVRCTRHGSKKLGRLTLRGDKCVSFDTYFDSSYCATIFLERLSLSPYVMPVIPRLHIWATTTCGLATYPYERVCFLSYCVDGWLSEVSGYSLVVLKKMLGARTQTSKFDAI